MESPLSPDRVLTLRAAARRIAPHAFADTERGEALVTRAARRITALPRFKRRDFELALDLLGSRWATLATGIHPVPFAALTEPQQDRLLTQWSASRIGSLKTVVQAVRRLVLLVEYTTPQAQQEVGYLGPFHRRDRVFAWEGSLAGSGRDDEPVSRTSKPVPSPPPNPWTHAGQLQSGGVLRAEVLVIGSGAGGATVAARMAERGHDVLLLEGGPPLDAEDFSEQEGAMFQRLYADGGMRATDDLSVSLLQGATLGGGTTVNWMVMLRTPDWVLHEWASRHGAEGLSPRELASVFDRIEQEVHATVVPDDAHSPNNRLLLDGAHALGWEARAARINARDCVRAGFCGVGCRYGAKQGALQVFLPRAVAAGARIVTRARAERIEIVERGGRFPLKRVHVIAEGAGALTVEVPVIVIAGGAVETPALLQRSGMGGGAVGRFLRLHPTTLVAGVFDRDIYSAAGIPLSVVCDEHLRFDGGGYGFWLECPPLHPALAAVATPGFGDSHREAMLRFRSLASIIALVRDGADLDQSNGDVRASREGRVRIRYRLGRADSAHLTEAIVAASRVLLAAGASEVRTLHARPAIVRSEQDLVRIRRLPVGPNDVGLFSAHVNGTCRLGTNRESSGTDPNGERWDAPGVFVADGSLLPTAPGVNPQETIMALATVVADRIAARRRPG